MVFSPMGLVGCGRVCMHLSPLQAPGLSKVILGYKEKKDIIVYRVLQLIVSLFFRPLFSNLFGTYW